MQEEFVVLNTMEVQMRSLHNFMYSLGYFPDATCNSGRFVSLYYQARANRYISFDSAVRLHNTTKDDWHVFGDVVLASVMNLNVAYTQIGVYLALSSKLVEEVKLGVKRGEVYAKDMMIKPLNEYVRSLVS